MAGHLSGIVREAARVIETLGPDRLALRLTVQGYNVTLLEAVYSAVEHFSGHTGQIIYATKLLTGEDLGYYSYLKTTAAHTDEMP